MVEQKTYVEFSFCGAVVDEVLSFEVESRDIGSLRVPDGAFGFQFFDQLSTMVGKVELVSGRLNKSPMHYYGGRVMTLEEVRAEMPEERILILNMECNGYDRVIQCRYGNFKPFDADDVYVEAS